MFSEPPPPLLSWGDIVLSAVAFGLAVVTLPTAFQMWWGRPSLAVEFERERFDSGVGLCCRIRNAPVRNKLLSALGVVRETAHGVAANEIITESGSGKVLVRRRLKISVEGADPTPSVDLHTGIRAVALVVFQATDDASAVASPTTGEDSDILMGPGQYDCEVTVVCGNKNLTIHQEFVVCEGANSTLREW